MIHTVTGLINPEELGLTLMHEHILWAWVDEVREQFTREKVIEMMLPFLLEIKDYGVKTIVEPTTDGAGRDVELLKDISEKSGIQIISNCGVWDGLDYESMYVPKVLFAMSLDEIAQKWIAEFENGMDGSNIKPGFIKLAYGDHGYLTAFHEKVLHAAIKTSLKTGLTIQAHLCSSASAKKTVQILEEENFPLHKFIWTHADFAFDDKTIFELADKGIWIETDWNIAKPIDYSWHVNLVKAMKETNLLNQLLISQDVGGFHGGAIGHYTKLFTDFIPYCTKHGIEKEVFDKLLIENPAKALDV